MLACPRCRKRLTHLHSEKGVFWGCSERDGTAVHFSQLRRSVPDDVVDRLERDAEYGPRRGGHPCPSCTRKMVPVPFKSGSRAIPAQVCPRCRVAWFDRDELSEMPQRATPLPPPPVAPLAPVGARPNAPRGSTPPPLPSRSSSPSPTTAPTTVPLRYPSQRPPDDDGPGTMSFGDFLPLALGFPVEMDAPPRARMPVFTWSIVGLVSLVSLLMWMRPDEGMTWAFLPSQAFRHGGMTFLTAFFLHAGVWHLASNMYFLWVFGDNVEDHLRPARYLLLLLLATVAGNAVHAWTTQRPDIPCVGASGGISGVIAYYALAFPQVRIGVLIRFFWLHMSARTAFIVWFGLQTLFAILGEGNVSYVAHVAGALVGLIAWLAWR